MPLRFEVGYKVAMSLNSLSSAVSLARNERAKKVSKKERVLIEQDVSSTPVASRPYDCKRYLLGMDFQSCVIDTILRRAYSQAPASGVHTARSYNIQPMYLASIASLGPKLS
jgi:hypothetical protein